MPSSKDALIAIIRVGALAIVFTMAERPTEALQRRMTCSREAVGGLLAECERPQREFAQFRAACIVVDQYYIPARYPYGIPGSFAAGLP